jgi:dinuclear metal center YbgI/SA1388 family protein
MGVSVRHILALVEKQAPMGLAYAWDRVGLLIGSEHQEVNKLVVALEASAAVLHGAVAVGAEMVLSHHPLLFQPVERLWTDKPLERTVAYALKHDLAVAAAHTNLDIAQDGLNSYLARILDLTNIEPLEITRSEPLLKLAVFVPVGYEDRLREAVCRAGAGFIGNYSDCSFSGRGQGTYRPGIGARPWRGVVAELNRVAESRLEVVIPEGLVAAALEALKAAHPYEEVAYDLYPLKNQGVALGIGRVGEWAEPRPFEIVAAELKQVFRASCLKVTGKPPSLVKRVAVCGGSGGELISQAWEKGADVYITGDIRYHQAVPWSEENMAIMDLGHYNTEVLFIPEWGRRLETELKAASWPVEVIVDRWGKDPFAYV